MRGRSEIDFPTGGNDAWGGFARKANLNEGMVPVTQHQEQVAPGGFSRPQIVWMSFLASMTVFFAFFMLTTTAPREGMGDLPSASVLAPSDTDRGRSRTGLDPARTAMSTAWTRIVVHDSGFYFDDADDIARRHVNQGNLREIGYHFVIGNGNGSLADGQIHVTTRWDAQRPGAHVASRLGADPAVADGLNRVAIGICLVGNGDQKRFTQAQTKSLAQLVTTLQSRLSISDEAVHLHSDLSDVNSPGRYFPVAEFESLLAGRD
ncbi:MAG: hypothetical protein CMJ52_00500 [Planctomycetaceae bacterium]|nr:hypothetical protein [Planctomycetaceae bacterium]